MKSQEQIEKKIVKLKVQARELISIGMGIITKDTADEYFLIHGQIEALQWVLRK